MNNRTSTLVVIICALFLLAGCGGKDNDLTAFKGTVYPPTTKVNFIYLASQAAPPCRVFAELLVTLPAGMNGEQMREQLEAEAKKRGADTVLIGQSRQMEDDEGVSFVYYGPQKEYLCNAQWCGWKFGYDAWDEQGDFVNIGFKEWGNKNARYDFPIMLQAAFLHCQQ
ncbi:MAG TPA: hypothetical protein ENI88_05280 [Desulfobulbus sp.]|nr:hypothetical protein [Desulfobulbus sp.]